MVLTSDRLTQRQHDAHQKRLVAIKTRKKPKVIILTKPSNPNIPNYTQSQHRRQILLLVNKIFTPKTKQDRLKDIYDFVAYPALFFRKLSYNQRRKAAGLPSRRRGVLNVKQRYPMFPPLHLMVAKLLPCMRSFSQPDIDYYQTDLSLLFKKCIKFYDFNDIVKEVIKQTPINYPIQLQNSLKKLLNPPNPKIKK